MDLFSRKNFEMKNKIQIWRRNNQQNEYELKTTIQKKKELIFDKNLDLELFYFKQTFLKKDFFIFGWAFV